jgi:hypothetical protein
MAVLLNLPYLDFGSFCGYLTRRGVNLFSLSHSEIWYKEELFAQLAAPFS